MPVTDTLASSFPAQHATAACEALQTTLGSILGETPQRDGSDHAPGSCTGVLGIISFIGELPWTFTLLLPQGTAVAVAERFAGFEIPYDSPDMSDVVGELANVIAGEIVSRLEKKGVKGQMSLPSVIRGQDVELTSIHGGPWMRVGYRCKLGEFALALAAAGVHRLPMPGK